MLLCVPKNAKLIIETAFFKSDSLDCNKNQMLYFVSLEKLFFKSFLLGCNTDLILFRGVGGTVFQSVLLGCKTDSIFYR